jgi:hypothetical protein
MLAKDEHPFDVVPIMKLLLAFEAAKNALFRRRSGRSKPWPPC